MPAREGTGPRGLVRWARDAWNMPKEDVFSCHPEWQGFIRLYPFSSRSSHGSPQARARAAAVERGTHAALPEGHPDDRPRGRTDLDAGRRRSEEHTSELQ